MKEGAQDDGTGLSFEEEIEAAVVKYVLRVRE